MCAMQIQLKKKYKLSTPTNTTSYNDITLKEALIICDEDDDTSLHWACLAQTPAKMISLFIEYGNDDGNSSSPSREEYLQNSRRNNNNRNALQCCNNVGEYPMDVFARE